MEFLWLKAMPILLIFGVFINRVESTVIKINDRCSCEQFLYEEECQQLAICKFENNQCSYQSCSDLDISVCNLNKKCANWQSQCIDFISCSSHIVIDKQECEQLHPTCYFSYYECLSKYDIEYLDCAQQEQCIVGKEGLCSFRNGRCQEMIKCSEVNYFDRQCELSIPACKPSLDEELCIPNNKCSDHAFDQCLIAKEKINGDEFLLCQDEEDKCVDYDPTTKTKETCALTSFQFYHWDGNACSKCHSNLYSLLEIFIILLAFTI